MGLNLLSLLTSGLASLIGALNNFFRNNQLHIFAVNGAFSRTQLLLKSLSIVPYQVLFRVALTLRLTILRKRLYHLGFLMDSRRCIVITFVTVRPCTIGSCVGSAAIVLFFMTTFVLINLSLCSWDGLILAFLWQGVTRRCWYSVGWTIEVEIVNDIGNVSHT
jgi:hypothetical protein